MQKKDEKHDLGAVEANSSSIQDERIRKITDAIESSLPNPLSVRDLAKVAGVSRSLFFRIWTAQMKLSPYQYILVRRIERAKSLLLDNLSVTEAAFAVGFRDVGQFIRIFRKHMKCTPAEFKQSRLSK